MKKKIAWYTVVVLIIGLTLLAVSCARKAPTIPSAPPTEAPKIEKPVEKPKVEEAIKEAPPTPTAAPPTIPHTLEGRSDCLLCHGQSGIKPYPADHAGRTSATCTGCHQPPK